MSPGLSVSYGTERGRFLVPAALVAWVIALGLTLPWLFADLPSLSGSPSPAITILLSSSAIFSGLVLRSGEHPLVRLMLAPYRLCLRVGDRRRGRRRWHARVPRVGRDARLDMGSRRPCGRPVGRYPDL